MTDCRVAIEMIKLAREGTVTVAVAMKRGLRIPHGGLRIESAVDEIRTLFSS